VEGGEGGRGRGALGYDWQKNPVQPALINITVF
jgi:hypothetical protein